MLRVYESFRKDVIGSEEVAHFEGLSPLRSLTSISTGPTVFMPILPPLKLPGLRLQRVASVSDSEDPVEYSVSRRANPDAQCAPVLKFLRPQSSLQGCHSTASGVRLWRHQFKITTHLG